MGRSIRFRKLMPLAAAMAILGCSGGGGGMSGNGNGGNTPRATPSLTVRWTALSRDVGAPASARSCRVSVTDSLGATATWSFDRGSNIDAFSQRYAANSSLATGLCNVSIDFYAGAGEAGAIVASARDVGTLSSSGTGLDEVTVVGSVTTVTVPEQSVQVGQEADLVCEPRNGSGTLLALQPGSVFWAETGAAATVSAAGHATGVSAGTCSVTARVDGITSTPATFTVNAAPGTPSSCGDPLTVGSVGCTLGVVSHAEYEYEGRLTTSRIDEMSEMGASYLRMILRHDYIDPTDSTSASNFSFDQQYGPYDTMINEALAKGMRVVLIVGLGYASPSGSSNYVVPTTEPTKSVYDAFLRIVSTHYQSALQSHKIVFEVWNEPTSYDASKFGTTMTGRADTFMTLFNDTVSQVRSVAPDAIIAAPTLALYNATDGGTAAFMSECISKGLLSTPNLMLDVHPGESVVTDSSTGANIDLDPETRWGRDASNADTVAGRLTLDGLRQMAPTTPILISEWSFNCSAGASNQAAQMVRSFLCGMDVGATSINVYQYLELFKDNGVAVTDRYEIDHGLINRSGVRTANWLAFQNFVSQLKDYTPQGHIQVMDGGHHYRYVFQNGSGGLKVVTWSQGASFATSTYPLMPLVSAG